MYILYILYIPYRVYILYIQLILYILCVPIPPTVPTAPKQVRSYMYMYRAWSAEGPGDGREYIGWGYKLVGDVKILE